MKNAALSTAEAKTLYIDGAMDLLLYLKKLFSQSLDTVFPTDQLPEELVAAYNQLIILLNSSISGLRLPASMIRSMLSDIRSTLKDEQVSSKAEYLELIKQLEAAANIYISITNTEQEISIIAQKYKETC